MASAASFESARSAARSVDARGFPASSITFDWVMGVLAALLMGGIIQDGWAHSHGLVDQSFLTPWHAVLYSMMALTGVVLGALAVRNYRAGYPASRVLPYGYGLALVGVIAFAIGGTLDLGWHTVFGIETGIEALLSPSHLILAFSAALIFSGPLRSVASQRDRDSSGWSRIGPAVLAASATLVLLSFFAQYAQPIAGGLTSASMQRDTSGPLVASLFDSDSGSGSARRLALPPAIDAWGVTVSPDGQRLAYRAQAPGTAGTPASDLYVAQGDGSHAIRITHSGMHDTQPAWSPDGAWLAYIAMPANTSGSFSLRIVRPDGTGQRTLLSGTTTLSEPAWSPDSRRIVYASRRGVTPLLASVDVAGGTPHWLDFTQDASWPVVAGERVIFATSDGALHSVGIDGSQPRVVVTHADGAMPAVSRDGRQLAYVATADGGSQVFVAAIDGSHPRDVSLLPGMFAARPSWTAGGHLIFTATPRPAPEHTEMGTSLAEAANLIQAVLVSGLLLLLLRRWRTPVGTFTVALTLLGVAMATQSDAYPDAVAALITGILADLALLAFGNRLRSGIGFYAFAFALPAVLFATYTATTIAASGGTSWTPNLILGSPLVAGFAGLLVAFCFAPPLPEARPAGTSGA